MFTSLMLPVTTANAQNENIVEEYYKYLQDIEHTPTPDKKEEDKEDN